MLDDSIGQNNQRFDLKTWIDEKLGVSSSDVGDQVGDVGAEWEYRSSFKSKKKVGMKAEMKEKMRNQMKVKRQERYCLKWDIWLNNYRELKNISRSK